MLHNDTEETQKIQRISKELEQSFLPALNPTIYLLLHIH